MTTPEDVDPAGSLHRHIYADAIVGPVLIDGLDAKDAIVEFTLVEASGDVSHVEISPGMFALFREACGELNLRGSRGK